MKRSKIDINGVLFRTAGILLVLALLSTCFLSRLHAKYIVSDSQYSSAHVASTGIGKLELKEHEAADTNNSGIYELNYNKTVTENSYKKVIPGVDIPKDPFIELELKGSEVNYELFVKVTESNPFPEDVTYSLTSDWTLVDSENGIYKYKVVFEAGTTYTFNLIDGNEIKILKDNKLYVSEHYVGSGDFSLTFSAYLKQVGSD